MFAIEIENLYRIFQTDIVGIQLSNLQGIHQRASPSKLGHSAIFLSDFLRSPLGSSQERKADFHFPYKLAFGNFRNLASLLLLLLLCTLSSTLTVLQSWQPLSIL